MRKEVVFLCLVAAVLTASGVTADPLAVGSGSNSAYVYIEWKDGFVAEFDVAFDEPNTGLGLMDIIEADTTLTTERVFDGEFINGISYQGHSDLGVWPPPAPEDWWHYWIKDSGEENWVDPGLGASTRVVYDGGADGWVFGRDGAVPEPATMALLGLGGWWLRRKKRT